MKLNVKTIEPHYLELEFEDEDVAFPHALREILISEKDVEFAAVRSDHPQVGSPVLILRTKSGNVVDALEDALKELKSNVKDFKNGLKSAKKPKSK